MTLGRGALIRGDVVRTPEQKAILGAVYKYPAEYERGRANALESQTRFMPSGEEALRMAYRAGFEDHKAHSGLHDPSQCFGQGCNAAHSGADRRSVPVDLAEDQRGFKAWLQGYDEMSKSLQEFHK